MPAIMTKYLGPTNTRGARLVAWCDAKRIVVPWSYEVGTDENHKKAATALAWSLGWLDRHDLVTGTVGALFVHVLVSKGR
jgi:hypothetical protein